jgi:dephospho-CoA kinase
MSTPYLVGLTGGIGSGKSEVARAFAARGVEIADADEAAHAATARDSPGYRAVVEAFGANACGPDGNLDRAWLRRAVFADREARERLERILHPLVNETLAAAVAGWTGPYGILSVPLLLERGTLLGRIARVLVVDCPEDQQVLRVVRRSGLAPDEVRGIMAAQLSRAERLARADDVIDNAGPPEAIAPQVARLDAFYRAQAQRTAQERSLEPGRSSRDNVAPFRQARSS